MILLWYVVTFIWLPVSKDEPVSAQIFIKNIYFKEQTSMFAFLAINESSVS